MSRIVWGPSRYVKPIKSVQYRPNMNVSELRDTITVTRQIDLFE
jgi:hypothetical protein